MNAVSVTEWSHRTLKKAKEIKEIHSVSLTLCALHHIRTDLKFNFQINFQNTVAANLRATAILLTLSIYFTKSQHVATSSFIPVGNRQATDTKMNVYNNCFEISWPILPDRVEFKHTSLLNLRQNMLFIRAAETYLNTMWTD